MIIHNVVQGSPEWQSLRASFDGTASEAPTMMGQNKYQKRDDLLKTKATGVVNEITSEKQALFNRGHEAEASIRPHIESIIGEELFPVTGSIEADGLRLLASFDGMDMMETVLFEHKLWNESLAEAVLNKELEPHYYWQLEQQLLVSGAETIFFVVSDGTPEKMVYMEYKAIPGRREQLIAGWKQFKADLANYQPAEPTAPKAIAEPVAALPAINYEIDFSNGLSVRSNLEIFKLAAQELVEKSKVILVTDQDFENAKARIKECEKAEANIKSLIDRVLGELGDVNTFKADLESIGSWIKQSRLNQDKQVKTRTAERKAEIINSGKSAARDYIVALNQQLATVSMPLIPVDFEAAVYRKSSFDSMQSAVNDALAAFKIEADRVAKSIAENLELIHSLATDYLFLFSDMQQLVVKDQEAVKAIAKQRISEHKIEEQKKVEAEAQRIANEVVQKRIAFATQQDEEFQASAPETPLTEAPAAHAGQPIHAATPAQTTSFATASIPTRRPPDDRIIEVLAAHYRVHESVVIGWLLNMDLKSASERMVASL